MVILKHASPEGTSNTIDNEKTVAGADHVERVETNDNDLSLAKVKVDAKLDEFGARSKTNPEEIALVKKLDRTILVSLSPLHSKFPSLIEQ
jgi:hypothetical protein